MLDSDIFGCVTGFDDVTLTALCSDILGSKPTTSAPAAAMPTVDPFARPQRATAAAAAAEASAAAPKVPKPKATDDIFGDLLGGKGGGGGLFD
jgi:hypothetical protein